MQRARSDGFSTPRMQHGCQPWERVEEAPGAPPLSRKVVNASEKFLSQRDDDSRRASHVAQPVLVLVLDHLADELSAVCAEAGHGVVDVFDREHDLPEA